MMDAVQKTLSEAGLTMDDLVSTDDLLHGSGFVCQVQCVSTAAIFTATSPARAFIGVSKLVRGAHFEIAGTAIKSKRR